MLAQTGEKKQWEPQVAYFDLHAKMTADLIDMMQQVRNAIIASNLAKGKKPPEFKPYPTPTTAAMRLSTRVRLDKHKSLADRVLRKQRQSKE